MCRRELRANNSGQLLIVGALAIAILISVTTVYVYELGNETNSVDVRSINNFILAIKQSTRNTMISSLANVSNGGERIVLTANLDKLSEIVRNLHQFGISQLNFGVLNDSVYDSGIWLSWNTNNLGVSSACANFTLKVYGIGVNVSLDYAFNITTSIVVNGYYIKLANEEKMVNLTCRVYNEGEYALVKEFNIFYEKFGEWKPVNSLNGLSIINYGNGTYTISFTADTPSEKVQVLVNTYDLRDIFVQANTTCSEV